MSGLLAALILAKEFLRLKLANDIRISVLPIILGDGVLFFNRDRDLNRHYT